MNRLPKSIQDIPEFKVLKKLDSPKKIQDFINRLPVNKEERGDTCASPLTTLQRNKAHCMEGALVAALALWVHGQKPLIMDLKTERDSDHIVVLYKKFGCWGAITKTGHAVLRYREPVYKNIRELALSYFHEYFLDSGKKTLRSYSEPFDLSRYKESKVAPQAWITSKKDLWKLEKAIDRSRHHKILNKKQIANLRKADDIEIKAGKLKDY